MAERESSFVVWGAIAANLVIAISKFIAAAITRSSAILAEAIHSTVDTADGVLLLVGMRRSKRPADRMHPFGHGSELYFWTLLVAVVIFGAGGAVSVYEGVLHVIHPNHIVKPMWNYAVLGVAAVFEGISWTIAMRHFLATKPKGRGILETIRRSKDPTQFVVLLEDSAALVGVAIAFAGTALGATLHNPLYDGIASILIGVVLCIVAVILIWETRGLLIGESVDHERANAIRELILRDDAVDDADWPLTMHFGPEDVLLNLSLRFRRDLEMPDLEEAIRRIERDIRACYPEVRRIFLEASRMAERRRPAG